MSGTLLSKAAANQAAASPTTLERVTIPISGMTCAACQSFIQRTLSGEPGVQDAAVNLMLNNATVAFDANLTSTASLVEKIRGTGYGAEIPALDQSILDEQEKHDEEQLREYRQLRLKALTSVPPCSRSGATVRGTRLSDVDARPKQSRQPAWQGN